MKALIPLGDAPLSKFLQGLAEYGNQDAQVSLAQQVLYGLGIATAENVPPIQNGESLPEYIERLDPTDLAAIEGLGISAGPTSPDPANLCWSVGSTDLGLGPAYL
jgi:hypothetical protein